MELIHKRWKLMTCIIRCLELAPWHQQLSKPDWAGKERSSLYTNEFLLFISPLCPNFQVQMSLKIFPSPPLSHIPSTTLLTSIILTLCDLYLSSLPVPLPCLHWGSSTHTLPLLLGKSPSWVFHYHFPTTFTGKFAQEKLFKKPISAV